MWFGLNDIQCTCTKLGCANELFEMDGNTHPGRLFSRKNYASHVAAGDKLLGPPPSPQASKQQALKSNQTSFISASQNPANFLMDESTPRASSSRLTVPCQQSILGRKRGRSPEDAGAGEELRMPQRRRTGPRHVETTSTSVPLLTFSSLPFKTPLSLVQSISSTQSMLHVLDDYLNHNKSEKTCRKMLEMERLKVQTALNSEGSINSRIWTEIPKSIEKALKIFDLVVPIVELVCCPICFTMHGTNKPPHKQAHQSHCTNLRFPSKTSAKPKITCRARLYKTPTPPSNTYKPHRLFFHQRLTEWLARMMSFKTFELSLEGSISRKKRKDGKMSDIWDGSMWRSFKLDGKIYTQSSGNLVFGFFCDWFNPYGKQSARHISVGILLMVCFNLPPDIRYDTHNLFLYGMIPGPREPTSEQMEPFLSPLIDELKTLSTGIYFSETSLYPQGRLIRAVCWPLIADVPAMKKVSGFSSHSSTNFCSKCYITLEDINDVNLNTYKCRTSRSHRQEVQLWLEAPTAKKRNERLIEDGVRYTVFSELPYWQPIEFPTVDPMHCLILGLLRDLSTQYFQIATAGKHLQTELDNRDLRGDYSDESAPPEQINTPQSITPSNEQSDTSNNSSYRSHYPRTVKYNTHSSNKTHTSNNTRSSNNTKSSNTESQRSTSTIQGEPGPALTPHELSILHQCIKTTKVPSWLTRVPTQIGMARCGTPKAAEWLTLYSIYMVLSLIPYLDNSEPNSASAKIHKAICSATQIVNISTSRVVKEQDLQMYSHLLVDYRTHLQKSWPAIRSKQNLHYAQHLPEQCRRYGPLPITSSWFGERTIGTLVQTPKNKNQSMLYLSSSLAHLITDNFCMNFMK